MNPAWLKTNGRRLAFVILAALAVVNGGCAVLAVGAAAGGAAAAGYAYVKGQISYTFDATFDDTWAATRQALSELNMPILEEDRKSSVNGTILTHTSDDTRVRIEVEAEHPNSPTQSPQTSVYVRVGVTGDYPMSDRIMTQINAHFVPNKISSPNSSGWGAGSGEGSAPASRLTPTPLPASVPPPTAPPPLLPPEPVRTKQ
jgi:hypothetical protein